ncbi:MAG: helix-turn-helix transcriptional regulator [Clostridiales bacterium]|nr:helix-turn-helix transcriptional regulator [Clostridiales bacterium]
MVDYKDLGERIRTLRRKRSLTQEELAEQVGISASFMGHIERGSRVASLETLVALCNNLKTTPQYLLSASLDDDLMNHMPSDFSPEQRSKLSAFLRVAQDTIEHWSE